MELSIFRRTRYARRAADLYRNDEADWITSHWLCELDEGECVDENEVGSNHTIGMIRKWLRTHGFGTRNRRSGMCVEGALLVALAEDRTIPDDEVGSHLLRQFDSDARDVAEYRWIGAGQFETIYALNDHVFQEQDDAVELLDKMSKI